MKYNYFNYWSASARSGNKSKVYDNYSRLLRKYMGHYGLVLDGGCGDGRYFKDLPYSCGVDVSILRLKHARLYPNPVCLGDLNFLPFKDSAFNASCTVQVLMHVPSYLILRVLKEFMRITTERLVHLEYYSKRQRCLSPHCFNHNLEKLYGSLGWRLKFCERLPICSQSFWVFEKA